MSKEAINHPSHYNAGTIEVIDFIEAWNLNFCLGNAIKYIARAPYKNNTIEDLKKASWYLAREIETREKALQVNKLEPEPTKLVGSTLWQALKRKWFQS